MEKIFPQDSKIGNIGSGHSEFLVSEDGQAGEVLFGLLQTARKRQMSS